MGLKLQVLPSISKSALILSPCTAWARDGALTYKEEFVEAKERDDGTIFHQQICNYLCDQPYSGSLSEQVRKWLRNAEAYINDVLRVVCNTIYPEYVVGINWQTGESEAFPDIKGRNYPERPGWQFGTADIVAIKKDGGLLVADWKTGPQGGATGAEEQLLSLGYALQSCFTTVDANGYLLHRPLTVSCLQVNEDGVWPHDKEVSEEVLSVHRNAMDFRTNDIIKGVTTAENPGVHCTMFYCPHLAYCSAVSDFVLSAATGPNSSGYPPINSDDIMKYNMTDTPASSEEAGFTQAMISAAQRQTKYLTTANKKRVEDGGSVESGNWEWLDKGNGYRWYRKSNNHE